MASSFSSSSRPTLLPLLPHSPLLLLVLATAVLLVFHQQARHVEAACGLEEFLTAYNDPNVPYYLLTCNIVLNSSLPALSKTGGVFRIDGKMPGVPNERPFIDGVGMFSGIRSVDHKLTLTNVGFRKFLSKDGGSAVHMVNKILEMRLCSFEDNVAGGNGGAMFLQNLTFRVFYTDFFRNTARGTGGAITALDGASCRISYSRFRGNLAGKQGGAVHRDRGYLIICENVFTGNTAIYRGGAFSFYADDKNNLLQECGNTFQANNANPTTSNNMYNQVVGTSVPSSQVRFCGGMPASTLNDLASPNNLCVQCGQC